MRRIVTILFLALFIADCGQNSGTFIHESLDGTTDSGSGLSNDGRREGETLSPGDDTDIQSGSSEISSNAYYDAAVEILPSFSRDVETSISSKGGSNERWEHGNPVYNVFYLMQDFDPDKDQGVIDTSNIYKTMWETRGFLSRTIGACEEIEEQVIAPPFGFGNPEISYDCAFNNLDDGGGYAFGGAYKKGDDEIESGLFGFVWAGREFGVVQAELDNSTGAFSFDIAVWVNYEGSEDYCYRNDITGNTETHYFTLRSMKGNKNGHSYPPIVGAGYSQGEDEYFLVNVPTGTGANMYYCIGAEDGEKELKKIDAAGSENIPEDCVEFEDAVNSLDELTTDDLACLSSDFNRGGTGVAEEGTVFLNYQGE